MISRLILYFFIICIFRESRTIAFFDRWYFKLFKFFDVYVRELLVLLHLYMNITSNVSINFLYKRFNLFNFSRVVNNLLQIIRYITLVTKMKRVRNNSLKLFQLPIYRKESFALQERSEWTSLGSASDEARVVSLTQRVLQRKMWKTSPR